MGKVRKLVVVSMLMTLVVMLNACGSKEKQTSNESDEVVEKSSYKFQELSQISTLSNNEMVKYTSDYTDVELYEWSENVTLPIPKIDGAAETESIDRMLTFTGVTEEVWNDYVSALNSNYTVIECDDIYTLDGTDYASGGIIVTMEDKNVYVSLNWNNKVEYSDAVTMENVVTIWCFLGTQETNAKISKTDVKKMIFDELGVSDESTKNYYLYDVTSRSNEADGFNVYYLKTPTIAHDNHVENINMYLCVMRGEKIVFLEPNVVTFGSSNNEIEFLDNEMYILAYETDKDMTMSDIGNQVLDKYVLKDDYFVLEKTYTVADVVGEKIHVTLEKTEAGIDLYELLFDKNSTKDYSEVYSVGDKLMGLD